MDGSSSRHVSATDVGAVKAPTIQRSYPCRQSRQSVSTSRKSVFQVHGVDAAGQVVTVGMVGDLQGIAGKAMPEIPSLDMPLLEASTDPELKVS